MSVSLSTESKAFLKSMKTMTGGGPALSESILVVPELLFYFRLDPVKYHSV